MSRNSLIKHLNVEVTGWCNQACSYCFNDSRSAMRSAPLDLALWDRILTKLMISGLSSIHVTGGEPFSVKNIVEFLALCQSRGLVTSILSNGLNVGRYCAESPEVMGGLAVAQISLDSLDASIMKERRGTEVALRDATDAVVALRHLSVPVEISSVLDSATVRGVSAVREFARHHGCSVVLRNFEKAGRGVLTEHSPFLFNGPQNYGEDLTQQDSYYYLPSQRQEGLNRGVRTIEYSGRISPSPMLLGGEIVSTVSQLASPSVH